MWRFTLDECKPYIKPCIRKRYFIEGVNRDFLGYKDEKEEQANLEDAYCKACIKAKKNVDCSSCSRMITRNGGPEDTIKN